MQTKEWFTSDIGKMEYASADSLAKKTEYYYNYLLTLNPVNDSKQLLKLAYIMADAIDGSSLEYSGWPDILDIDKNPLLAVVSEGYLIDTSKITTISDDPRSAKHLYTDHIADRLLCALHYDKPHFVKIDELQQPDKAPFNETIYMIEREIIQFFCYKEAGPYDAGIYNRYDSDVQEKNTPDAFEIIENTFQKSCETIRKETLKRQQRRKHSKIALIAVIAAVVLAGAIFGGKAAIDSRKEKARIMHSSSNIVITINSKESLENANGGYDFSFPVKISNNSEVGISGFNGHLAVFDTNGTLLLFINDEQSDSIDSKQTVEKNITVTGVIGTEAASAHAMSFDELTIYYEISQLLFSDGYAESALSDRREIHKGIRKQNSKPDSTDNGKDVDPRIIGFATVIIDDLNIRNNPSTSSKVITLAKQWTTYQVYETAKNGGYNWYRIDADQWIANDPYDPYLIYLPKEDAVPNSAFFGRWVLYEKENGHYRKYNTSHLTIEPDGNWTWGGEYSGTGGEWLYLGNDQMLLLLGYREYGEIDDAYDLFLRSLPNSESELDTKNVYYLPKYTNGTAPLFILYDNGDEFFYITEE